MLLTIAQAAEALGMTPGAVRKAIEQGRITPVRLSARVVLIDEREVARYRAEPRRPGGRPKKPPGDAG